MTKTDLDRLYRDHAVAVRAVIRGMMVSESDVDDCFQATWVIATERIDEVTVGAQRAWLLQVAKFKSLELFRRGARGKKFLEQFARSRFEFDVDDPTVGLGNSEMIAALKQALERLPDAQRQVVEQRIYQEKTFQEIADQLQIPLGTALTRMRAALEKLSREFRDADHD